MLTLHQRRRLGETICRADNPHAQYYRASANDPSMSEDDAFRVARLIIDAVCVGGCALATVAVLWLGAVVLMGW